MLIVLPAACGALFDWEDSNDCCAVAATQNNKRKKASSGVRSFQEPPTVANSSISCGFGFAVITKP
jgi:hypothetical protein